MKPVRPRSPGGWWLAGMLLLQPCCSPERISARPPSPERSPRSGASVQCGLSAAKYVRKAWKHWVDADRDCQDTRQEVLIAESEVPVAFRTSRHCRVASGRWTCPYTGRVFTDPKELDIDHLVPLENAHRSGAACWDLRKKQAYANDLTHPEHLIAVDRGANRAKGARGPEEWLPQRAAARCRYVRDWLAIKKRWGLTLNDAERAKADEILQGCLDHVPGLPATH